MPLHPYALTSIANVKSHVGISGIAFDFLIEGLINSITDWIERQIGGRRLLETTYVNERYDGGRLIIFLNQWPINPVPVVVAEFLTGTEEAQVWQPFMVNDFVAYHRGGFLKFFGTTPQGFKNLRFTYKAGYSPIPSDLELVCRELTAKAFDTRRSQGKSNESVEGQTISWSEMITPEQKATLTSYARKQIATGS